MWLPAGPVEPLGPWPWRTQQAQGRTESRAASSVGAQALQTLVPQQCCSCFPLPSPSLLPPPQADPLLPLSTRQGNHRVWKSWVFRRKQSHDPQGEGLAPGAVPIPVQRGTGKSGVGRDWGRHLPEAGREDTPKSRQVVSSTNEGGAQSPDNEVS